MSDYPAGRVSPHSDASYRVLRDASDMTCLADFPLQAARKKDGTDARATPRTIRWRAFPFRHDLDQGGNLSVLADASRVSAFDLL
ncbi:MAG: hypothetical protein PHX10_12790 [Gallionellaceae bacterium]|nr:hypothetical protein [Gallionellaceae bacterium]